MRLRLPSVLALLALATTGCFSRPAAAPGNTFAAATPSPSPSPTPSPTESPRDGRTNGQDTQADGELDPGSSASGKQDTEQPSSGLTLDDLVQEEVANCSMTSNARNPAAAGQLGSTDYMIIKYDCDGLELVHELMPYDTVGRAVGAFTQIKNAFISKGAEAVGEQPLTNRDGEVYGRIVGLRNANTGRDTLLWGNGNLLAGISGPRGASLDVFFQNVPY